MNMSNFKVELKKVVDDSYEIEIGYELEQKLIDDLKAGRWYHLHRWRRDLCFEASNL